MQPLWQYILCHTMTDCSVWMKYYGTVTVHSMLHYDWLCLVHTALTSWNLYLLTTTNFRRCSHLVLLKSTTYSRKSYSFWRNSQVNLLHSLLLMTLYSVYSVVEMCAVDYWHVYHFIPLFYYHLWKSTCAEGEELSLEMSYLLCLFVIVWHALTRFGGWLCFMLDENIARKTLLDEKKSIVLKKVFY